ncbi:hypothetical protein HA402_002576 [Bradysia odoriphaga]|nr:hypothetical protein HA402_002576 [Bradysia odoriphaga]
MEDGSPHYIADWSRYPPNRIEGIKLFWKGPTRDEDGPCTIDELKEQCQNWNCSVNMKVDNFVFWAVKSAKEKLFNGNDEELCANMPKIARTLRKSGMSMYQKYQQKFGAKNREYLAKCKKWRRFEIRKSRWLQKLDTLRMDWSDDDSDTDDDSESDGESSAEERFADYIETESEDELGKTSS